MSTRNSEGSLPLFIYFSQVQEEGSLKNDTRWDITLALLDFEEPQSFRLKIRVPHFRDDAISSRPTKLFRLTLGKFYILIIPFSFKGEDDKEIISEAQEEDQQLKKIA